MKTAPALAALLLVAALLTPSCSVTSQVSLDYVPAPGHTQPGAAEFTTRPFVDRRGEHPTFLGTVRTQIGTPVEQVNTRLPVDTIVTNAFGHALQARGMLTSPSAARYIVTGEVLDLYCQMLVRPYGYARLRVSVLEAGSGQIISMNDARLCSCRFTNRAIARRAAGASYLGSSETAFSMRQ